MPMIVKVEYYEPDIDYEQEGKDPYDEPIAQEEESPGSYAEYSKIELPCLKTCKKRMMQYQLET